MEDDEKIVADPEESGAAIESQTIGYARPGAAWMPSVQRLVGRLSLVVGTISVLVSGVLAAVLGIGAVQAHQQIVGLPAQMAMVNGQNAGNAALQARRVADYQALLARRRTRAITRSLTEDETARVIGTIETQIGHKLSASQTTTLRAELQKAGQQVVDPALPIAGNQLTRAQASAATLPIQTIRSREIVQSGELGIVVSRVYSITPRDGDTAVLQMDAKGVLTPSNRPTTQEMVARLQRPMPSAAAWPPAGYLDQLQSEEFYFSAGASIAAANVVFALVLLGGGVCALRSWPRWAMLHRVYAAGQIACLVAIAMLWIWPRSFSSGLLDFLFQVALAGSLIFSAYPLMLILRLLGAAQAPAPTRVLNLGDRESSSSATPAPVLSFSVRGPGRNIRFDLIGMLSVAVGIAGIFINIALTKMFVAPLAQARSQATQSDAAAAKEAAGEAAEAATEQRERNGPQPRGLTDQEAEAVIEKVESICGAIPDAERKALIVALVAPGQRLVDPSLPVEAHAANRAGRLWFEQDRQQWVTAIKWRNPELEFESVHRRSAADHPTTTELHIRPDGGSFFSVDSQAGLEQGGTNQPISWFQSYWGLNPNAGADVDNAHEALVAGQFGSAATIPAALLSALLLVAGILVLMRSMTKLAIRLHWIYVVAKPLLALFGAFAFLRAVPVFGPGDGPAGPEVFGAGVCEAIAVALSLAGCLYPILLLIMLNRLQKTRLAMDNEAIDG